MPVMATRLIWKNTIIRRATGFFKRDSSSVWHVISIIRGDENFSRVGDRLPRNETGKDDVPFVRIGAFSGHDRPTSNCRFWLANPDFFGKLLVFLFCKIESKRIWIVLFSFRAGEVRFSIDAAFSEPDGVDLDGRRSREGRFFEAGMFLIDELSFRKKTHREDFMVATCRLGQF